ncbi:MAG: CRISPR-associated helicase Cas3' [Candidatus Aegiribacteria sp.]|nr:CRISPR-associated helicase Cas3' [Candidatus Aegiribacteria sp.]
MVSKLDRAWGKLKTNIAGEVKSWHPLQAHCADVSACCEAFLRDSIIGSRLAVYAGQDQLNDTQICRLSFLAGLHDMGKYNHGFQAKSFAAETNTAGHVREMLALMQQGGSWTRKLVDALQYDAMQKWTSSERTLFSYLMAVVSHHGRPQTATHFKPNLWGEKSGYSPLNGISELVRLLRRWYPEAWNGKDGRLPESSYFQHAYYGLVTLADWIGSDEGLFPYTPNADDDYINIARERSAKALSLLWITPRNKVLKSISRQISFSDILPGCEPHPVQDTMINMKLPTMGSVTILEAETGSGKTEAAFSYFIRMLREKLVDGMYFALPTKTAATQIHNRLTKIVRTVFPDGERPPVVMAVPGYLRVDGKKGVSLPPFTVIWDDDKGDVNRYRNWAAERPKRYLSGSIVVGTIDQVLLSALQVNHSHMRAAALLRHLLIVDEVHASDHYMNSLLSVVLARHIHAGGHALLMSATLGSETRHDFLGKSTDESNSFNRALDAPYPSISVSEQQQDVNILTPSRYRNAKKKINIDIRNIMTENERIAEHAILQARKGAKVLIIRNTVRACLMTQKALEKVADVENAMIHLHSIRGIHAPHHSRYSRPDRILLDKALENHFGKEHKSSEGRIVAATQTVQQSLDLDADLMITDLCPMDVLLQRIGRLHRHSRSRPGGFEEARVVVLVPEERGITGFLDGTSNSQKAYGFGSVYQDLRIIEATWRELENSDSFTIPDDNRRLVESTTHSSILDSITREKGGAWLKHQQDVIGRTCADGVVADLNLSHWQFDFTYPDKVLFQKEGRAMTRLGTEDRIAVFEPPVSSPFGETMYELNLPAWMCGEVEVDEISKDVAVEEEAIKFGFGNRRYIYDRFGVQLLK